MIKKIKTVKFQKHSKALLFLLFSLICFTIVVFAAEPVPCKDCGTVNRCFYGNGEDYGYRDCEVIWNGLNPPEPTAEIGRASCRERV